MVRHPSLAAALVVVAVLAGTPAWAQVQSQPLPAPAGAPAATPPAKTEPARTPTPMTKPAQSTAPAANTCPSEKVDINDASPESLRKLPQIGVQRSNAIVKSRPYAAPEDLLKKKVLKKAVYDKIKTCITASGVAAAPPAAKPGTPAAKAPATAAVKPATPASKTPATPVPVPQPTTGEPASRPQQ